MSLQQDGMSIIEYEGKFHALARHASMILPRESAKVCLRDDYSDPYESFLSCYFWCVILEGGTCC